MGGQAAAGGLALVLFLGLAGGVGQRSLGMWGGLLGAFWGIWARGYLLITEAPEVALSIVIAIGVGAGVMLVALTWAVGRYSVADPAAFRMGAIPYGVVAVVIVALALYQYQAGGLRADEYFYLVPVMSFCVTVLWFQNYAGAPSALAKRLPMRPSLAGLAGGVVIFVLVGTVLYTLPPVIELIRVVSVGFGAFGLLWLPAVCVVLGVRAYRSNARTGKAL
ncbi:MAG: hypothetical protein AAF125_04275, partial [Chloroflexota bacterium]